MKRFTGAPWKLPAPIGGEPVHKHPDYFDRYKRTIGTGGGAGASVAKAKGVDPNRFEPCALNPGVALDLKVHKYRLLLFTNDKVEARGQFFSDQEGMTAYSALVDMKSMGPHGVQGVPASAHFNGPPGATILPKNFWSTNKGDKKRPRTYLLKEKGQWTGNAPDHNNLGPRPDLISRV
jgi:hypothetical protein